MNTRSTSRIMASLLAVIVMFAISALVSPELRAQTCNTILVKNPTGCSITLCAVPPGNPNCISVGANTEQYITPQQNNPIVGVYDHCGNFVRFPNTGCIDEIQIGANCCVKVCFDKVNCTITVTTVQNGCICRQP